MGIFIRRPSPVLRRFFRAYNEWATGNASPVWDSVFSPYYGLCENLRFYAKLIEFQDAEARVRLSGELGALYSRNGLSAWYPFNADFDDYADEADKRKNPARMAFVRQYL